MRSDQCPLVERDRLGPYRPQTLAQIHTVRGIRPEHGGLRGARADRLRNRRSIVGAGEDDPDDGQREIGHDQARAETTREEDRSPYERSEQQAVLRQQIQDDDLELQRQPELREQQQRLEAELATLDERLTLGEARCEALRRGGG